MARYRALFVQIWEKGSFQRYSLSQKLIFLFLISNNRTSESGIYPISLQTISNETGIPFDQVKRDLPQLKNVFYDEENEVIFLKNFIKYNFRGNPQLLMRSILNDFKTVRTPLWERFFEFYPEFIGIKEGNLSLPKSFQTLSKDIPKCSKSLVKAESESENDFDGENEISGLKEKIPFQEILEDLNAKTEKHFRETESSKELIKARWKEGFRLEDFQRVHSNMAAKWKNDPEMNRYLRPVTLYRASKFESYLNSESPKKELPLLRDIFLKKLTEDKNAREP